MVVTSPRSFAQIGTRSPPSRTQTNRSAMTPRRPGSPDCRPRTRYVFVDRGPAEQSLASCNPSVRSIRPSIRASVRPSMQHGWIHPSIHHHSSLISPTRCCGCANTPSTYAQRSPAIEQATDLRKMKLAKKNDPVSAASNKQSRKKDTSTCTVFGLCVCVCGVF